MGKIEKMAKDYGREKPFIWYGADGMPYWDINYPAIAYEAGANAVLDEIERTMSVSEDGWLESNLKKLVKELKG